MKEEGREQKEDLGGGVGGLLELFGLKGQAEVRGNEWNQENTARCTVIHSWATDISWLENSNYSSGTWRLVGQTAVLVSSAPQSQT